MNQIVLEIFNWYKNNSRKLPWRSTKDPYKIWLSEIILQQTQVKQGLDYYHNFIEKYPTVNHLSAADEADVLKLWQGLGYYSRARNLHKASKIISKDLKGKFPDNYNGLLKLPGIGEYTAAAIASFAFNLNYPVLDGNVFRFISRLFNIDLPIDEVKNRIAFLNILNEMMVDHSPIIFNNAVMELGAMICKPTNPLCPECPVSSYCEALKLNKVSVLPVKNKKTKIRTRYFNFIHLEYKGGFYIEKRLEKDIWQNLYQLPLIETTNKVNVEMIKNKLKSVFDIKEYEEITHKTYAKHLLTHQILQADFWHIKLKRKPIFLNRNIIFTPYNNYKIFAVPKLIDNYLLLL